MQSRDNRLKPAAPGDRLVHLDIIRGLALFGVLASNIETGFRIPLLEHILGLEPLSASFADDAAGFLITRGLQFKALTIFSLLFGVGVAQQSERMGGGARRFLARRLGCLFVLGLIHLLLLWNGDILALYGVTALVLLPALRLPWLATFALGALILGLADSIAIPISLPQGTAASALIEEALRTYGEGGFIAIAQFRWRETQAVMVPLLVGILPRTAGLMFWGMAAWRSGILREPARHREKLLAALAVGLPLGLANPDIPALLALAYLAACCCCSRRSGQRRCPDSRLWDGWHSPTTCRSLSPQASSFMATGWGCSEESGRGSGVLHCAGPVRGAGHGEPGVAGAVPVRSDRMGLAAALLWRTRAKVRRIESSPRHRQQ